MKILFTILLVTLSLNSFAECTILDRDNKREEALKDPLFLSISGEPNCPQNVLELVGLLESDGLDIKPSMVANRGRHNPQFGSFSFFESVTGTSVKFPNQVEGGNFFFGHFTTLTDGMVELDQKPRAGKLMIELIAWDYHKKLFNFYELIGTSSGGQWFYRGDSKDAYLDNVHLKKQPNPGRVKFGRRMRCSACHTSGGPIMKELDFPYNDWWTKERPLSFANNLVSEDVKSWIKELVSASEFASSVKKGITKLNSSKKFANFSDSLTLQEQLRPLFCTQEINLISGNVSNVAPLNHFKISSDYWVNPFLANKSIEIITNDYFDVLASLGMKFPETNLIDSDHPWLAPVKGYSDFELIKTLLKKNIVTEEFVADVLAVDFKKPLFSKKRCGLLRFVPNTFTQNWVGVFIQNLKSGDSTEALELLDNIKNAKKSLPYHKMIASNYINETQRKLNISTGLKKSVIELQARRSSVFNDEISKNPLGQILEPGFRVIFPKF